MFTGIITSLGEVVAIEQRGDLRIAIAGDYDPGSIAIGASIACSGVCLTVVEVGPEARRRSRFAVDVSAEKLARTTLGRWRSCRAGAIPSFSGLLRPPGLRPILPKRGRSRSTAPRSPSMRLPVPTSPSTSSLIHWRSPASGRDRSATSSIWTSTCWRAMWRG